jgi:hypothetical protein
VNIKKNKKIIFFGCLLSLVLGWQYYENRSVQVTVHVSQDEDLLITMPWKDRRRLTYLFYKMMVLDEGAYTLLGSKPMYMGGYIKPFSLSIDWRVFLSSIFPGNIRKFSAWKTWQKYAHLFHNSPFILRAEINPFWPEPHESVSILVINKEGIEKEISSHRNDFETVLQRQGITFELLLSEANEKPFLKSILKSHDGLIGTLFGYGRDNAWLFEQRSRGEKVPLKPFWGEEVYDFFANRPNGVHLDDLSLVLGYPCFLADPDSLETKELREKFLKDRERILDYYKGKDFLEATLSLLFGAMYERYPPLKPQKVARIGKRGELNAQILIRGLCLQCVPSFGGFPENQEGTVA